MHATHTVSFELTAPEGDIGRSAALERISQTQLLESVRPLRPGAKSPYWRSVYVGHLRLGIDPDEAIRRLADIDGIGRPAVEAQRSTV